MARLLKSGWRSLALLACLVLAASGFCAGCGKSALTSSGLADERLGYIYKSGEDCNLMLTAADGSVGESLLQWQGFGERFSFSNDGRYFTITLWKDEPGVDQKKSWQRFVASSDGSNAFYIPGKVDEVSFSPDSKKISYVTMTDIGPNEVRIMDIASGVEKTLARGSGLMNPTWVDDRTLVFTELNASPYSSKSDGGVVYRLDVNSGEVTRLTGERLFTTYFAPVSFEHSKLIVTERGKLNNMWSLDVRSGDLRQISNNDQYHFRAGYLAKSDSVIFQKQKISAETMPSEVCVLADDGSKFTMLTSNFFFDGLHSFSLKSGRIVFQRMDDSGATSIWTIDEDGSDAYLVTEAESGWLADPNFVPVSGWKSDNPLRMEVVGSSAGEPLIVRVSNPSGEPIDAMLRAFPGTELILSGGGGDDGNEAAGGVRGAPATVWNLKLEPGEVREISLTASLLPTVAIPTETALVVTLAVDGAPPRMYWQQFE